MKVILREDIASLGSVGQVLKVADGYARNYLIPKGMVTEASKGNLKQFEAEKEALLKKTSKIKDDAAAFGASLEALDLTFQRKTGEEDKLFGSVTSMDIAAAIKEKGFDVEKKLIGLTEPIKSLGTHEVPVKLHAEVAATLKVVVVKEDTEEKE